MVAERTSCIMSSARKSFSKCPPVFEENIDYDTWKKDIELWEAFTDLPANKFGIAVHLSLKGRARSASSELQDPNWKVFNTYLALENYGRPVECTVDEYLSEFDNRHFKLEEVNVNLPDAVVACRLLKSCNLSDVHFQLALSTTSTMTFKNMRKTLKRLFTENIHLLTGGQDVSVKVESADALYGYSSSGRGRCPI